MARKANAIDRLAKRENADIFVFNAPMQAVRVDRIRQLVCAKKPRRENCILFLTTYGGDADAAYRMAACLRRHYTKVHYYVFGLCKSAGTLALLGGDRLVFGDFGELGPLDVQLTKPDELISTSSGLDIFQAMGVLTNSAFEAFEDYFINIIEKSQGHISAKTSAEIARELAVGLFAPMTGQIDPERLGEVQRAITVATAYGNKLNKGILKRDALERLVQGYPTHGFVIDVEEAKTLFTSVERADDLESQVAAMLPSMRRPLAEPMVFDALETLGNTKGTSNVSQPKAKRASRSVPAAGSGRPGNVAQFGRNASRDPASAEENANPGSPPAKTVRPSLKPPARAADGA